MAAAEPTLCAQILLAQVHFWFDQLSGLRKLLESVHRMSPRTIEIHLSVEIYLSVEMHPWQSIYLGY